VYWHEVLLSKLPDLGVTFLGVLLGALLAFWIERGVARWQIRRQREIEERRDKEQLLAYMDRVKFELRDNALTVQQLQRVLEKSPHARVDLFRWATRLTASLSVAAYEDLVVSGLQRYLEAEVQSDLFDARQRTVGLKAMVEAGEPAIEFYIGYSADEKSADLHLENAKTYSQTAVEGLIRVRDLAYSEAAALKEHLKQGRSPSLL
jgi:hypothetical protein